MKVLAFLDARLEEIIVVAALFSMFVILSMQIFMRYVMQNSLTWSEELARYIFILFVNVGISFGIKTKRHIRVEAFTSKLPQKAQVVVRIFSDVAFLVFALVVIYYGFITSSRIFTFNQISPALRLPMGFVYITLPISYIMVAIRLLQNIAGPLRDLIQGDKT